MGVNFLHAELEVCFELGILQSSAFPIEEKYLLKASVIELVSVTVVPSAKTVLGDKLLLFLYEFIIILIRVHVFLMHLLCFLT